MLSIGIIFTVLYCKRVAVEATATEAIQQYGVRPSSRPVGFLSCMPVGAVSFIATPRLIKGGANFALLLFVVFLLIPAPRLLRKL